MPVDADSRQLLQDRLRWVFALLSSISLIYAVTDMGALFDGPGGESPVVPLVNLAISASNGALALRCRTGNRSLRELHVLDGAASAITCWLIAALFSQMEPPAEASISLQLSVTYVLLARAVLLPSSGWRTFVVCLIALVPGAVMATFWRAGALGHPLSGGDWLAQAYVVGRNLALTIFLATLTSQVIYGLRRRVREIARVGQYVLLEKLGEGGMGVVYRATHALLRRQTAVKLLQPERLGEKSLARFEREVKLTASLTHPNTVAVYDYWRTPDGVFYYAMEYLDGADLEQLVAYTGPLPPARVIGILEQVCAALAEAHELGLIHRDIKPSNVLLCERGREGDVAKLVDFGLVRDLNAPEAARLTQDRALTGTPLYMSPEAVTGADTLDHRSDLYSLGAVAYFLLTGAPVFTGQSVVEVCLAHMHQPPLPPSLTQVGVPSELDAIVLRCLEKKPDARYRDTHELRADLLACAAAEGWNPELASAWWRAHGGELKRRRAGGKADPLGNTEPLGPSSALMRVDFDQRRAL